MKSFFQKLPHNDFMLKLEVIIVSKTIQELQNEAFKAEDDFAFYEVMKHLTGRDLVAFFNDSEEFFIDSECKLLAVRAKRSLKLNTIHIAHDAIKKTLAEHGHGSLFKSKDGLQFAIVHPSVEGRDRVTFFDERGFFCHEDHNSLEDCADAAFRMGTYIYAPDLDMDGMFAAKAA